MMLPAFFKSTRVPPPGRMVDVGGRQLHVYEAGTGRGPTVVFESGFCATSLNWRGLQRAIAPVARSIAYDRSGLGWSDPIAPCSRTPLNLALELRSLLRAAGTEPPYILVGHSFGCLIVQRFAALCPGDVAGILLLDPLQPAAWWPLSQERARELEKGRQLAHRAIFLARCGLLKPASRLFLRRLHRLPRVLDLAASGSGAQAMARISEQARKMPAEVWPAIAAHWSNPQFFRTAIAYLRDLPESTREMTGLSGAWPLVNVPLVTITAGENHAADPAGTHIQALHSGHWIHLDEPDLVAKAILGMTGSPEILPHGCGAVASSAALDPQPVPGR